MTQNNVGIYASQISGHLYGGPYGAYDSLATVTVPSGGAATIEFANIPSGYKHLQLRCITRTNGNTTSWQSMRFNGSTSTYADHWLVGDGSSASAGVEQLGDRINYGQTNGSAALANAFGAVIIDILDYSNTNKAKTVRFLEGNDVNGGGYIMLRSGLWTGTSAITSILIGPQNFGGTIYTQYSQFALYGVK